MQGGGGGGEERGAGGVGGVGGVGRGSPTSKFCVTCYNGTVRVYGSC